MVWRMCEQGPINTEHREYGFKTSRIGDHNSSHGINKQLDAKIILFPPPSSAVVFIKPCTSLIITSQLIVNIIHVIFISMSP